jgi:hypothetical protein
MGPRRHRPVRDRNVMMGLWVVRGPFICRPNRLDYPRLPDPHIAAPKRAALGELRVFDAASRWAGVALTMYRTEHFRVLDIYRGGLTVQCLP